MRNSFFCLDFAVNRDHLWKTIDTALSYNQKGCINVVDGVVLTTAHRQPDYLKLLRKSLLSICDSSYLQLYIRALHNQTIEHYTGSDALADAVSSRRYKMMFVGGSEEMHDGLYRNLSRLNPSIKRSHFYAPPQAAVDSFDYRAIASLINRQRPDLIWVSMGAPKQERFMHLLLPHIHKGVIIPVGAAFKFLGDGPVKRAPEWMINLRLEFLYRALTEPRKQIPRCWDILSSLPSLLLKEYRLTRQAKDHQPRPESSGKVDYT